jgi:enamine deaminase RidA (YjgF/YER057c/UK114 family)
LAVLATLQSHCGSLDRVKRLVKTFGLVQSTPEFVDQPAVINGFSELMRDVFGEACGIAARSAVGAASLPAGMAVEIEAIFELEA